nr:MAG TPA: Tail tape measure [Caudoviricetes sp.]
MADKVEKILDIKVNYNEAVKAIAEYQTKIDAARDAEKNLKKQLKDGEISRQQYNEEMAASKIAIADYNDAIRIINKTVQNQIKQEKEQEGSLKALRAELSNLTAEYDALSETERKGASGEELKNKINEVTDALKGAEEETQRYYRNVGNYKEAIIEAANANIPFVEQINQMVTSVTGLKDYLSGVKEEMVAVTSATSGLTKVLKLLKVALVSTGIGALVVALGSLVSWFTKTQKGIETANKIMGAFGATLNVIIDRVSKLGSALVNLFTGNFKQSGEDAKAVFSGIGKEIADETKQAWKLAEVLNEIDKKEVMLSMSRAANRAEIEKLKKAADDQTLSTQERIKAAEKAAEIEKKDLNVQTQLAEARLANTLGFTKMTGEVRKLMEQIKAGDVTADEVIGKLGLSDSTIEDLRNFRDQFNELQELMEDSYGRQTEQQNTLNSIRQEGVDKAKEAKQKELEAVRAAEDAMLALVKDKREQARKEIELTYSRQIEDLRARLKTESDLTVKARQAINDQIKALEQQKAAELQKLSEEELQKEIDNRTKLISLQLEAVKEGSEQEYQLRMQQLLAQRDAELADKELTEQMKLAIVDKYDKQMDDLILQREQEISEKQQEAVRLRMENEIMQLQQSGASELEILQEQASQKLELLNSIQQQEGESEQEFLNRKLQANQEYIDAKKAIADKEVEIEQVKFQAIETITSGLSSAFETLGENNKTFAILSKTLALAEIAINTGKALAAGIAQAQSVPFPANLAAIATTVATILSNIAVATKTVKSAKFATGGLVTGPGTGTSDSIPAQLSNGESVMTARATSMFAPLLSSFNQMGGGVPINVTQTSSQALGEDMLARAVAKGVQSMRPVVSVEEITSVSNRVKVLENLGNV